MMAKTRMLFIVLPSQQVLVIVTVKDFMIPPSRLVVLTGPK